jgi:carbamoyltransferase
MTAVLGISGLYHDAAAALVVDGRIVAAMEEERFSRTKHDAAFPEQAIAACLRVAGIGREAVDHVAFYDKPLLKLDRLLETYLAYAPLGLRSFAHAMPAWMSGKLFVRRRLRGAFGEAMRRPVFTEHHVAHAASAFYPSPFEEAAIVTLDGVGEWATACIAHGRGRELKMLAEQRFPHSLGLLYSAFTEYLGFRVNSGEYKVMGLAPYGRAVHRDAILERVVRLEDDGSFRLDLRYFDFCAGLRMTSPAFHSLFRGPPRGPESEITERHADLAASIQAVTEEIMLRTARHARALTGAKNLCLAGGVALNCVGNGKILRESGFERLFIQPAAGDSGGALGAALYVWHELLGRPRAAGASDAQQGSLLGTAHGNEAIGAMLDRRGATYTFFADEIALCEAIAGSIAEGAIVGWFQGRMEFGPRALGCRSILADPRRPEIGAELNLKIKLREAFRPFAPAVLAEHAGAWFELPEGVESPYMLVVADVCAAHRREAPGGPWSLERAAASDVPAVTHVDGSARVQTVDAARHGRFRRLIEAFFARTGCPMVVNTSFNVRGQPIVESPEQALDVLLATEMDVLVLENHVIRRSDVASLPRPPVPVGSLD